MVMVQDLLNPFLHRHKKKWKSSMTILSRRMYEPGTEFHEKDA